MLYFAFSLPRRSAGIDEDALGWEAFADKQFEVREAGLGALSVCIPASRYQSILRIGALVFQNVLGVACW